MTITNPISPSPPVVLVTHYANLGHGSSFQSGVCLDFDDHTFQEFLAFQCNCSEEAMLQRWAEAEYEHGDPYEREEEEEHLLLHDQLVDEYLDQYAEDPTISGLTFTEWAEHFAPTTVDRVENEEDGSDLDQDQ